MINTASHSWIILKPSSSYILNTLSLMGSNRLTAYPTSTPIVKENHSMISRSLVYSPSKMSISPLTTTRKYSVTALYWNSSTSPSINTVVSLQDILNGISNISSSPKLILQLYMVPSSLSSYMGRDKGQPCRVRSPTLWSHLKHKCSHTYFTYPWSTTIYMSFTT